MSALPPRLLVALSYLRGKEFEWKGKVVSPEVSSIFGERLTGMEEVLQCGLSCLPDL